MTQQVINVGSVAGDGTGDKGQVPFQKVNADFTELYNTAAYYGVDSGAPNAYVVLLATLKPNPLSFPGSIGTLLRFLPANANTGAATLNGTPLVNVQGSALSGGEIQANTPITVQLTSAGWQLADLNTATLLAQVLAGVTNQPIQASYTRTLAEVTAGVTPVNFTYLPGVLYRYGTNIIGAITGITTASSAVITINTVSLLNPFSLAQTVGIYGVGGMTQINRQSATVTAIGGASGAWTIMVNINSSAFSAYTSGGTISLDMTNALTFAANACRQGNYVLQLPADTLFVSSSLNFSGIRVIGSISYPFFTIQASSAQFNVITSTGHSVFENFGVDGGWDGSTTGLTGDTFSLVGSPTCYGITFKNVRAWNNKARGVFWQTAGYSMVEALDVFNSCLDGIAIFAPNLANISTTVHIFGNTRSSGSLQGGGLRITEANSIYCDGMIMENNAHGIQLAGTDNRNLVFKNIYQEVITDLVFLDGTTSAGIGLTISNCFYPAATIANLNNWVNVYLPANVLLQRPLLPLSDRIVQNDGGAASTSTTGGVSVTAAQITLNPGTWLIFGTVQTLQNTATGMVESACQISTSSSASGLNNSTTNGVFTTGADQQNFVPGGGSMDQRLSCFLLVQPIVQTTYYLRTFLNFSGAGALTYHGYIQAVLYE